MYFFLASSTTTPALFITQPDKRPNSIAFPPDTSLAVQYKEVAIAPIAGIPYLNDTEYLSSVISKLTIFGGFFLALIAIIPMMARFTTVDLAFGGTSILIIVGVALETMQQLESQVVMKHYKGFLE